MHKKLNIIELSKIWGVALTLILSILNITTITSQCSFTQYPPGEVCSSAHYICGSDLNGYTGRLPESLSVPQLWLGCNGNGVPDNIVWFSFTPTSNRVTICITPSNCTIINIGAGNYSGLQAGIFSECKSSAALDCTDKFGDFNGKTDRFCLTSDLFVPCQPAFLFLDGYAASVCDFHIEVIEGIDVTPVNPPDFSTLEPGYITGPDTIECNQKNTPIRYTITPPECLFSTNQNCTTPIDLPNDSLCFEWNVTPSQFVSFVGGVNTGSTADIIFRRAGNYTISASSVLHPFYGGSCGVGGCAEIFSWQVYVKEPDTLRLNDIYICPGQSAVVCGNLISSDTLISCFTGPDECTLLLQRVLAGTNQVNDMGVQYICTGDVFTFQNASYSSDGTYEVVDDTDCTLLHRFNIVNVYLDAQVVANINTLDCNNDLLVLMSNINSNFQGLVKYKWINPAGSEISSANEVSIDIPGNYRLITEVSIGNTSCKSESTVLINRDVTVPVLQFNSPTFSCQRPTGIITVSSSRPLIETEWTLPVGGQTINSQNLFIDTTTALGGGNFRFVAKAANGCSTDTIITLTTDFQRPALELRGEDLTCKKPVSTLNFVTDMPFDSVRWIYNGNFQTTLGITFDALLPGNYKVEVRANRNKCWNDDTKFINEDKIRPLVEAGPDLIWNCNTNQLDVTPFVSTGPDFEYFWQSNNGLILSPPYETKIEVGSVGTYVIEVLNKNNGCTSNDLFSVHKESNVPVDIMANISDPLCNGERNGVIEIQFVTGGFDPYEITLNGQHVVNNMVTSLRAGSYIIEAKDKFDCTVIKQIVLSDPPELYVDLPLEIELAFKENARIDFETNYPKNEILNIVWKNNHGQILGTDVTLDYEAYKDEEIIVEIETINGCKAESRVRISVDNDLKLFIPNIFSPNGDGSNDVFFIGKNKIPAQIDQIAIYDRFGNKVFDTNSMVFNQEDSGWDGKFNGKEVVPGVYVLIIQITDYEGQKHVHKRDLTLIR